MIRALPILILVGCVAQAHADQPPARHVPSPAALAHYKAGDAAYSSGEFKKAIDEFRTAYAIDPAPLLLFNIAQAYRLDGQPEKAIFIYRQYLAKDTRGLKRRDAEGQITALEALLKQQQETKEGPPVGTADPTSVESTSVTPIEHHAPPATPPPPTRKRTNPAGWGVAGAGLGLCVVGAGLLGAIPAIERDARNARDLNGERSQENRADVFQSAGWAMVGIGAAAVVAGAVVLAISAKRDARRASLTVTPVPSGAALSLGGRW